MKTPELKADRAPFPYVLAICALYLSLLGICVYVLHFVPKDRLTEVLKSWMAWNFRINLALLLGGLVLCHEDMLEAVRPFWNKRGILLVLLLVGGFLAVYFLPERTHRIYFDEDIYTNIGQVMAMSGKTGFCNYGVFEYGEFVPHWIEYNKEPGGWPFLMSIAFQLLGAHEPYSFLLNNLLFVGSILLVFLIALEITAHFPSAFWAGLVYALIPHNLIWSNTAASEPSAAFFAGAVVYALLVFLRTGKDRHLFILAVLLPLACQMRPESGLIVFWVSLAILVFSPRSLANSNTWMMAFIAVALVFSHLLHFHAVGDNPWGAQGPKFALSYFLPNLEVNGAYYFINKKFPVIFTALSILGFVKGRQAALGWRGFMLLWFIFFWGIFLFFYAGSYGYGADDRFSLLSFMPLAVLAGMGVSCLRDTLARWLPSPSSTGMMILVVAFSFMGFLPLVRMEGQEAWGARYDHKFAHQAIGIIPRRSVVITQIPTMFLLWDQGAIQTYAAVNQPQLIAELLEKYNGHVYFHYNFWCNCESKENISLCQRVEELYDLEEIFRSREQNYEYGFYKVSMKTSEGK